MTTQHAKKLWQAEVGVLILAAVVAVGIWAYQRLF